MQRALLPNVLASLGYILIVWALTLPLFEWEVNLVNADYPPNYQVHFTPSPWKAKLGESLDDSSYIFRKIFVSMDQQTCLNEEGLNIMGERSLNDKELELLSIKSNNFISWLPFWSLIPIILSGIYMWWVILWRIHRPISEAVASTVLIAVLFCFLIGLLRLLGPTVSWDYFVVSYECRGALTFSAELSKIHYEMPIPIILVLGIFAELVAFAVMLREIVRTIIQGKDSSKLAVG
jgi:hypothetical protein